MEGRKRFAVLQCAQDTEYVKEKYGGYFGVYIEMLAEEGETWNRYRVSNGEFPEEDELDDYDGFVITGSREDAHGDNLWIINLVNLLQKLNSMNKIVLGICFGHQILARALGGKTGRAKSGWDIGITTIQLSSSSSNLFTSMEMPATSSVITELSSSFNVLTSLEKPATLSVTELSPSSSNVFASLEKPATLSVIECHQDEVYELPPEAEIMAWSIKTGIEMFRYGDHMMGIQGHPEYTKDILLQLIDGLLQSDLIQESLAEEAKSGLEVNEPDSEAFRKLCTSFLKGRLSYLKIPSSVDKESPNSFSAETEKPDSFSAEVEKPDSFSAEIEKTDC